MRFYKVSGSGNDFIALPGAADTTPPTAAEIRAWCRRGISLGADGVFLLRPRTPGEVTMVHFNADGTRAGLCLNGTRCAARLSFELGWASHHRVTIHTDAGPILAEAAEDTGDSIALTVPPPATPPTAVNIQVDDTPYQGILLTVGVPHLVLPWTGDLALAPVQVLGAALVHHGSVGEAGANIDFARFVAPDRLEIRTYERGVNAETLACGTGVLACTAAGIALGQTHLPVRVQTQGGFVLRVDGEIDGEIDGESGVAVRSWRLIGDARLVARGELLPGASVVPT